MDKEKIINESLLNKTIKHIFVTANILTGVIFVTCMCISMIPILTNYEKLPFVSWFPFDVINSSIGYIDMVLI